MGQWTGWVKQAIGLTSDTPFSGDQKYTVTYLDTITLFESITNSPSAPE